MSGNVVFISKLADPANLISYFFSSYKPKNQAKKDQGFTNIYRPKLASFKQTNKKQLIFIYIRCFYSTKWRFYFKVFLFHFCITFMKNITQQTLFQTWTWFQLNKMLLIMDSEYRHFGWPRFTLSRCDSLVSIINFHLYFHSASPFRDSSDWQRIGVTDNCQHLTVYLDRQEGKKTEYSTIKVNK